MRDTILGESLSNVPGETSARTNVVKPSLGVLDGWQVDQVHGYSLEILSCVGVRVDSGAARALFGKAAGTTALDGDRVRIPGELVEWALQAAPSMVEIYDRQRDSSFRLPGETRFGVGVTALYYQEPETERVVPFSRSHMESMVRLGSALPSFDVVSTIGIIQDVPPEVSDLYAALEMTANTVKPLVLLVSKEDLLSTVFDLLEHLHGDLASRPFLIPYFNPISPLVINRGTANKMLATIERGLPFIYSNYGMAGASTPITPGGALALLNAELLAGLTLSQLIREGTPLILGSMPAFFDMRGTGSFYDPRSYLIGLACAEIMAHYGLPHCGTSGSGMGWGADLIAAGHQWMNHLLSCMGKVGLAPFVGDNLGAMAFSPAVAVLANEIIQQARLLAQGFTLDADAIRLEEIAMVGPGGNFLTSSQTLDLFRTAWYRSEILPNLALHDWQACGCPRAEEVLHRHTQQLLMGLKAPEDHSELIARGEAFIEGSVMADAPS
jgi:trimethylamine--corrinoid protein Co-methyltransferase